MYACKQQKTIFTTIKTCFREEGARRLTLLRLNGFVVSDSHSEADSCVKKSPLVVLITRVVQAQNPLTLFGFAESGDVLEITAHLNFVACL
jgi:hypothetical protein